MKRLARLTAIAALVGAGSAAAGPPMDLARREHRWVEVRVVTTPPDARRPRLSQPARAWYTVGPRPHQRTVTVPGPSVERAFFADRRPLRQSFTDFVWVFDASTGHVVSAGFSGEVVEPVRFGPFQASARVSIAIALSTLAPGGYREPRELAGRRVFGYCADPEHPDCTSVASAAYDPGSGWVEANGAVCASWRSLRTLAYTSLGRARFAELRPHGGPGEALDGRPEASSRRNPCVTRIPASGCLQRSCVSG